EEVGDVAVRYRAPLYALARRRGFPPEDADDALQSFFAKLIEREALADADPAKGRFRAFLRASFDRFLVNVREGALALKRGAGRIVAFDAVVAERAVAALPADADRAFDRSWAQDVFARALRALETGRDAAEFAVVRRSFGLDGPAPPIAAV